ncbi:hypothetical protein B6U71_04785 [Euryarchaeota archaeon ex4484_178]|nr:MAG: hypothetical protein B6U71_04785 [Euryarchaeota archaeon ex4484_178]
MEKYDIRDPAVLKMAEIVRGADIHMENSPPLSIALDILARGYRMICKDDHETLEKEFHLYDAMYAYFKNRLRRECNHSFLSFLRCTVFM